MSSNTNIELLCDKIDLLLVNVDFIEYAKISKKDCIKLVKSHESKRDDLIHKLKIIRILLNKYTSQFYELQEVEKEVQDQISLLNSVELYFENNCNEISLNNASNCNEISLNNSSNCEGISLNNASVEYNNEATSQNYYSISPNTEVPRKHAAKVTPNYLTFDIPLLTDEEHKAIPKYMLGRLSLESINSFIDVVNNALSKKYQLLSKPANTLKGPELMLYKEFKVQQRGELKVKRFVTESDIAREYNKPVLEKRCCNFLSILRHCKRILRVTVSSKCYYVIN